MRPRLAWLGAVVGAPLMLLAACATPAGPRPVLSAVQVSAPSADGVSALRVRVTADFDDMGGMATDGKVRHMLDDVTLALETTGTPDADKLMPAVVVGTVTTDRLEGRWRDRVGFDVVVFPAGYAGRSIRLRATNLHATADDDPSYIDLSMPGDSARGRGPVKLTELKVEDAGEGRGRLRAVLDKDAPTGLRLWHHLGGKVFAMERRGTRLFTREWKDVGFSDHVVFVDLGPGWMSAPSRP